MNRHGQWWLDPEPSCSFRYSRFEAPCYSLLPRDGLIPLVNSGRSAFFARTIADLRSALGELVGHLLTFFSDLFFGQFCRFCLFPNSTGGSGRNRSGTLPGKKWPTRSGPGGSDGLPELIFTREAREASLCSRDVLSKKSCPWFRPGVRSFVLPQRWDNYWTDFDVWWIDKKYCQTRLILYLFFDNRYRSISRYRLSIFQAKVSIVVLHIILSIFGSWMRMRHPFFLNWIDKKYCQTRCIFFLTIDIDRSVDVDYRVFKQNRVL